MKSAGFCKVMEFACSCFFGSTLFPWCCEHKAFFPPQPTCWSGPSLLKPLLTNVTESRGAKSCELHNAMLEKKKTWVFKQHSSSEDCIIITYWRSSWYNRKHRDSTVSEALCCILKLYNAAGKPQGAGGKSQSTTHLHSGCSPCKHTSAKLTALNRHWADWPARERKVCTEVKVVI